ncbi:MAG: MATE family efflux transporter [Treponema sp.]|nr:MAG: MATE family efflux transporter [Treponema sp.]
MSNVKDGNSNDNRGVKVRGNSSVLKTTKGLWVLAYPTMIATALQSFYDIVDMTWIGQYSQASLTGVTLFSILLMLFGVLNSVAGASSVSMISQAYGRGDKEKLQRISEQTISFKVVLAIISGLLLALLMRPILSLYTDSPQVIKEALDYGWIRIFFLPLAFSSYSVNTIFRCTGNSKMPMRIMIVSTVLNFILDPIFIFDVVPDFGPIPIPFEIHGFGFGVFGAALATVTSITISFLYGFISLFSGKHKVTISLKGLLKLDKDIDFSLLKIGLPSGFNQFVRTFFITVLMWFVSSYGDYATALAGVGGRISGFAFIPLFGLDMAGATLIGHSLGKENISEAKRISIVAAVLGALIISIFVIFLWIFPEGILAFFFKNDPAIIIEGVKMLRIVSISFIGVGFMLGLGTVFSGSGHNLPLMYATICGNWLVQLPFLIITILIFKLPIEFVWLSNLVGEVGAISVILYHYKKGVWKTKRV